MAGTLTKSHDPGAHRPITRYKVSWTSDASGDVNGGEKFNINGRIIKVITDPDGTDAPTDNYDIVFNDRDGYDIMEGALANRDTANTEVVIPDPPDPVAGTLDIVIINAGIAKSGVIVFYVESPWK